MEIPVCSLEQLCQFSSRIIIISKWFKLLLQRISSSRMNDLSRHNYKTPKKVMLQNLREREIQEIIILLFTSFNHQPNMWVYEYIISPSNLNIFVIVGWWSNINVLLCNNVSIRQETGTWVQCGLIWMLMFWFWQAGGMVLVMESLLWLCVCENVGYKNNSTTNWKTLDGQCT